MSRKASKKSKIRISDPSADQVGAGKRRSSKTSTPKGSLMSRLEGRQSIAQTTQPQPADETGMGTQNVMVKYCNKRKNFTRMVMSSGIKASVVRALVALYEEPRKPDSALDYILCFMGADMPTDEETKAKLEEIRTTRERIDVLEEENEKMRERIQELEEEAVKKLANRENVGEFDRDEEENEEYFEEAPGLAEEFDPFDSCLTSNLSFAVQL